MSHSIDKPEQGKRLRQTTISVAIAWVWYGYWTLAEGPLGDHSREVRIGVPVVIGAVAAWLAWHLANRPRLADYLRMAETEIAKICWPNLAQCLRAAALVIATVAILSLVLCTYDEIWRRLLHS
jgi:preprotein translocase SecE subunit